MALQPWSTNTTISWRRTLRFYERRYEIFREIEDRVGISAYRREEDLVAARLPGNSCEVELNPAGLSLQTRNPDADVEQLLAAGQIVVKAMDHPRITHGQLSMKHVVPLAANFVEARDRGIAAFLSEWSGTVGVSDFSLLYDGVWRGQEYQTEFGVASGEELSFRLPGWVSRIGPVARHDGEADRMETPPDACLFVESHWMVQPDHEVPFEIDAYYAETVEAGNQVVEALMQVMGLPEAQQ